MRFQTRAAAALGDLKLFTGVTPGRLLQRATRRAAGQPATSSASSRSLPKVSEGVVLAAVASSWPANAVMLFCSSMAKIVISLLLACRALRGHHISRSEPLERQDNCGLSRRCRRTGDEGSGGLERLMMDGLQRRAAPAQKHLTGPRVYRRRSICWCAVRCFR